MEQMSIFDFMEIEKTSDLDAMSEADMVQAVKEATGIDFKFKDDLWGYVANIGKVQFEVKYSNYSIDDHRRFISVGYGTKTSGVSGPCDSLQEAIQFFKRALERMEG